VVGLMFMCAHMRVFIGASWNCWWQPCTELLVSVSLSPLAASSGVTWNARRQVNGLDIFFRQNTALSLLVDE
jgi:hypothetical protein